MNNAGVLTGRPILRLKPEEIRRDFAINVFSQYWTILEFLPDMHRADHGHILSMSSTAATAGVPYNSIYCATKFANKGMMESLYLEQRQDAPTCRVKWTTVLPFVVNTGMAYEPRTRFPFFMPIVEPEECARTAIDALLRDEEECFVPPRYSLYCTYKSPKTPSSLPKSSTRQTYLAKTRILPSAILSIMSSTYPPNVANP